MLANPGDRFRLSGFGFPVRAPRRRGNPPIGGPDGTPPPRGRHPVRHLASARHSTSQGHRPRGRRSASRQPVLRPAVGAVARVRGRGAGRPVAGLDHSDAETRWGGPHRHAQSARDPGRRPRPGDPGSVARPRDRHRRGGPAPRRFSRGQLSRQRGRQAVVPLVGREIGERSDDRRQASASKGGPPKKQRAAEARNRPEQRMRRRRRSSGLFFVADALQVGAVLPGLKRFGEPPAQAEQSVVAVAGADPRKGRSAGRPIRFGLAEGGRRPAQNRLRRAGFGSELREAPFAARGCQERWGNLGQHPGCGAPFGESGAMLDGGFLNR